MSMRKFTVILDSLLFTFLFVTVCECVCIHFVLLQFLLSFSRSSSLFFCLPLSWWWHYISSTRHSILWELNFWTKEQMVFGYLVINFSECGIINANSCCPNIFQFIFEIFVLDAQLVFGWSLFFGTKFYLIGWVLLTLVRNWDLGHLF